MKNSLPFTTPGYCTRGAYNKIGFGQSKDEEGLIAFAPGQEDYRPGVRPLALMQLLKTSALAPATPAIAASRSHSYASRPKVFVLSVSAFKLLLSLVAPTGSPFGLLLSLVVLRLPVDAGG